MTPISPEVARKALDLVREHGGVRAAVRASGITFGKLHRAYSRARELGLDADDRPVIDVEPDVRGRIHALPRSEFKVPRGKPARYIFTCAQNNTAIHQGVWDSLNALAKHYDARICVSRFTYDIASYGKMAVKPGKVKGQGDDLWYAPEIEKHVLDESVVVAPGLVWCGEMNILPTAVRPLSGFESYTGRKSGIFPHPKFALESVASGKNEGTKFNYTTGTITQRNYIAKKAGLKAEFHHGYGGLLVEVDRDGNWFCRQLNADSDGVVYDLDVRASAGRVSSGHRLEGITWGDIHVGTIPPEAQEMIWGSGGMMDTLKPRYQFLHDVLDWRARSHHDRLNPHERYDRFCRKADGVVDELRQVAEFLNSVSYREWCKSVVVDSNHDNAMTRWLREADYRHDPKNAKFFLEAQLRIYEAIEKDEDWRKQFHLVEWAMQRLGVRSTVKFLRPDESFLICHDANGGIECGMHGHLGPNGARGGVSAFARMGRKSNTGHTHVARIEDGAYCAGITGKLDQGYNVGPSSWSRSHIGTYANGKRAILTSWGWKWKA